MSSSVAAVSSVQNTTSAEAPKGLPKFGADLVEALKAQENRIQDTFVKGLDPSGDLFRVPDYMKKQFQIWEEKFTSPEELKMVDSLKQRIQQISLNNEDYVRQKISDKSSKIHLELAMKAVSKTTSGVQQLLSSQ